MGLRGQLSVVAIIGLLVSVTLSVVSALQVRGKVPSLAGELSVKGDVSLAVPRATAVNLTDVTAPTSEQAKVMADLAKEIDELAQRTTNDLLVLGDYEKQTADLVKKMSEDGSSSNKTDAAVRKLQDEVKMLHKVQAENLGELNSDDHKNKTEAEGKK